MRPVCLSENLYEVRFTTCTVLNSFETLSLTVPLEEEITNIEENATNDNSEPSIKHSFDGTRVSAFLLIKDDNSRVIEWLAYHNSLFNR